jgi:hypothetical protein
MKISKVSSTNNLMQQAHENAKIIGAAIEEKIRQKTLSESERVELIHELQEVISMLENFKIPTKIASIQTNEL